MNNYYHATQEMIDDCIVGLEDIADDNFLNKKLKKRIIKFLNKRLNFHVDRVGEYVNNMTGIYIWWDRLSKRFINDANFPENITNVTIYDLKLKIIDYLNNRYTSDYDRASKREFRVTNSTFIFISSPTVEVPIMNSDISTSVIMPDCELMDKIKIECTLEMDGYLIGYNDSNWKYKVIAVYKIPDEVIFYFPRDWKDSLISTIRIHLPLWALRYFPEAKLTKYIVKRNRMKLEEVK